MLNLIRSYRDWLLALFTVVFLVAVALIAMADIAVAQEVVLGEVSEEAWWIGALFAAYKLFQILAKQISDSEDGFLGGVRLTCSPSSYQS